MFTQILEKPTQDNSLCDHVAVCQREESIYPAEFVAALKDTAFNALLEFLQENDAPKEAIDLLDDLIVLTTIDDAGNGNQVSSLSNQILMETVASASRNIVRLGGVFYSPNGTTARRVKGGDQDKDENLE